MSITRKEYGEINGYKVDEYTLDNGFMSVCILNYGGIIKNIFIPDKNKNIRDVVLGHRDPESYGTNKGYYGALIGRHANRLGGAEFKLGSRNYSLAKNDGKASLHGGNVGFDKKLWNVVETETKEGPSVIMTIVSPNGDEGYPGTVTVSVIYTLTVNNTLRIRYIAVSDADTIFNMTNHSYFNLSGHASGTVCDHTLTLNCSYYTPNTKECMPNGEILSVLNTPFDFRVPKKIGEDIDSDYEQVAMFGGYDHNFIVDGVGMRKVGILESEESGISMTVSTNQPGVQIYTGNSIDEDIICKDDVKYKKHQAVCLETQFYPNSMKINHFPKPILKTGDVYDYTTEFRFDVE